MNEELKQARKAFEVDEEKLASTDWEVLQSHTALFLAWISCFSLGIKSEEARAVPWILIATNDVLEFIEENASKFTAIDYVKGLGWIWGELKALNLQFL